MLLGDPEQDWNYQRLKDYINGNLLAEGEITASGSFWKRRRRNYRSFDGKSQRTLQ